LHTRSAIACSHTHYHTGTRASRTRLSRILPISTHPEQRDRTCRWKTRARLRPSEGTAHARDRGGLHEEGRESTKQETERVSPATRHNARFYLLRYHLSGSTLGVVVNHEHKVRPGQGRDTCLERQMILAHHHGTVFMLTSIRDRVPPSLASASISCLRNAVSMRTFVHIKIALRAAKKMSWFVQEQTHTRDDNFTRTYKHTELQLSDGNLGGLDVDVVQVVIDPVLNALVSRAKELALLDENVLLLLWARKDDESSQKIARDMRNFRRSPSMHADATRGIETRAHMFTHSPGTP
jgi:hypothetical protein